MSPLGKRNGLLIRVAGWALCVVFALSLGYVLLWHLPHQAASQITEDVAKRLEMENSTRATGAQIFLGLGIFVGLVLTYRRMRAIEQQAEAAARQARTAEEGQITERFSRAIEQLGAAGDDKLAIRLGGIYSLERIFRDSEADAPTIQEVLAAWLREELERRATAEDVGVESMDLELDTDLKAVLSVLTRSRLNGLQPNLREVRLAHHLLSQLVLSGLDLARADFSEANLAGANLSQATLIDCHFSGAYLRGSRLVEAVLVGADLTHAKLPGANLRGADLTDAKLVKAQLRRADLTGAKLVDANLEDAQLREADLTGADLTGTDLIGADLTGANLTDADLHSANFSDATLRNADLRGAKLVGAQNYDLSGVRYLPDGSSPPESDAG